MKKNTLLIVFLFSFYAGYAQKTDTIPEPTDKFTVGIFQGGGSLLGFDLEKMITKNIGFSVGAGFIAYGAALHYHFKPSINSSSLAFNYMHQGIADTYVQSIVGPSYVFRISKRFSGQFGIGGIIDKGPKFAEIYEDKEDPDLLFIYSLGIRL